MALFSKGIVKSENLVFVTHVNTEQNYEQVTNGQIFHHMCPKQKYKKTTPPSNRAFDSGCAAFLCSQVLWLIHL